VNHPELEPRKLSEYIDQIISDPVVSGFAGLLDAAVFLPHPDDPSPERITSALISLYEAQTLSQALGEHALGFAELSGKVRERLAKLLAEASASIAMLSQAQRGRFDDIEGTLAQARAAFAQLPASGVPESERRAPAPIRRTPAPVGSGAP